MSDGSHSPSEEKLFRIIETTLADGKRELSDAEWGRLRIALGKMDFDSDFGQFVAAMVHAFLAERFSNLRSDPDGLERMSQRIANTLCSDPYARKRLQEFQQYLRRPTS